jgi:predicted DNA-binding protein with PD1-like motif
MSTHSSPRLAIVAPGVDLLEGLSALPSADAWISGVGHVEDVELRVAAEGDDSAITMRGRFNLLSLAGPRGGPFTVTLARLSEGGPQVLGGALVRARSAGVNVLMQPASRASGASAGKVAAGPATWAATAAASAARKRDEDHAIDDPTPEAGDWVNHFAFGLGEVLTSEGDRLRIREPEGARRVREVSLTMLRVSGPEETDGKRVFKLTRRTPG